MNLTRQKTGRLRRILGAVTIDVSPLRISRDYRLLYAGQFVSAVGYAFDAATFIASLVMLLLMRAVPPPENVDRPCLRSIKDGLLYARQAGIARNLSD